MPRVLIIDDSMFQRFNLAKTFKALQFSTSEAASGAEGIEKIKADRPDVVLLDMNMPGMSGLETLIAIRSFDQDIPVVILTADIQQTTKTRCEEAKATAFLNKPANDNQISDLMAQVLSNA